MGSPLMQPGEYIYDDGKVDSRNHKVKIDSCFIIYTGCLQKRFFYKSVIGAKRTIFVKALYDQQSNEAVWRIYDGG